ncbi:MAG: Glu/Leu/Phe/Val dehydrogenase dimerization domain-containing protein [Gemmatimonadales bacterium]
MEIFSLLKDHDHEQLLFCREPTVGYRGLIAIHNTTLGPALGGTRYWKYETESAAVIDALRLSKGMTYKAAVAGLSLGGGKSVVLADGENADREAIFRAHGRFVETLKGRYITAEDVGTSPADMDYVHLETDHVVGLQGRSGDPSPVTGYGVYRGMKASAKWKFGSDDLSGRTVAVQGAGSVGYYLCKNLAHEGAKLIITDIDKKKVDRVCDEFRARPVKPDEIYAQDADIYAPCALGAVINDTTIPRFKCKVIAGGANNVLAEPRHGDELEKRGILYAPDYVINAGGLINVNSELESWSAERALKKAGEIYDTMLRVYELAKEERLPTYLAADRLAEKRVAMMAKLKRVWV